MNDENVVTLLKNGKKMSDTILLFTFNGQIENKNKLNIIGGPSFAFIRDDEETIDQFLLLNKGKIISFEKYLLSRNQAVELDDYTRKDVRIEPGAIIRSNVELDRGAIVLMNATINIGANIGEDTMIDMGAVIGSRARVGKRCHIGANAVIAGVLEPLSANPVIIEDDCFVGAGSVILEGVKIGHHSIIGALSLVNKDVPPYSVVMGIPGKIIKKNDEDTSKKCQNNQDLRLKN